jgi:two-component system nitrate/nitrite response regulator NarL
MTLHDMTAPVLASSSGSRPRVVLADHDPISRRFLEAALRAADQLSVVAGIDSHHPMADWPLRQVDVVVLGLGHGDAPLGTVRELSSRMIPVLLIGLDWTRRSLDGALAAGASGCLTKSVDLTGVVSGVQAVASGNIVLSPELVELYVLRSPGEAVGGSRDQDLVRTLSNREREVLALLADGMSTAEAAALCGVSNATIKSHVSHALTKLGARNRLEAVLMVKGSFTPSRPVRPLPAQRAAG